MCSLKYSLFYLIFSTVFLTFVFGHGMLMDPPNRSSMWRFGFPVEHNYDDNANFCGGRQVQWEVNKGRCGTCGDNFQMPSPRPNENTGRYGNGYIGKTYNNGEIIKAAALITANHRGYFTFDLCELSDYSTYEEDDCFQPLKLANGDDTYLLPSTDTGYYHVELQLPLGLTCERCVLRWTYTAGNSWGICPDGTGKLGCGPQETFRTCSDISII